MASKNRSTTPVKVGETGAAPGALPETAKGLTVHLRKTWLAALACAFAALLLFLPAFGGGFVWDDSTVQKLQLPSIRTVSDAFSPPKGLVEWSDSYYRPMVVLSYLMDTSLTKAFYGNPHGPGADKQARIPHATVVLTHVLATVGVVLLASRLLRGRRGAEWGIWAAGLVFALHAGHTESVASVAGRSDTMAAMFLLFALLANLSASGRFRYPLLALSGLLFLCGLFSKEVTAAGLVILPLCMWLEKKEGGAPPPGELLSALAPFAAATAIYGAMRIAVGTTVRVASSFTWATVPGDLMRALAFYIEKLFLPWGVSPYVPDLPGAVETLAVWAVGALLILGAVYLFQRGEKFYLFALGWFFAALAPSLTILLTGISEVVVADRYLYLPSAAFALAVGCAAAWIAAAAKSRVRFASGAALALFLALHSAAAWSSTKMWESDLTLWTALTEHPKASRHALPWTNLGFTHLSAGNLDEAEKAFTRSLAAEVTPDAEDKSICYVGLADIRKRKALEKGNSGRVPEAVEFLRLADNFATAAANLNLPDYTIYMMQAEVRLQRVFWEKALYGRYNGPLVESVRQPIEIALQINPGNRGAQEQMKRYRNFAASAASEAGR